MNETVENFINCYRVGQLMEIDCGTELCTINIAISMLRPYIYDLPDFEVSEKLTNIPEGTQSMSKNIYKVKGFYGKHTSNCCNDQSKCLIYDEKCCECESGYGRINMRKKTWSELECQEFSYTTGSKWLKYHIPDWITDVYVTYYRYPDKLINITNIIDIPSHLLWLLALMVMYNLNQQDRDRLMLDLKEQSELLRKIFEFKWESTAKAIEGKHFRKL